MAQIKNIAVNKSQLFTAAHAMVKKFGYTLSKALKECWKSFKLKAKMAVEVVEFEYKKKDGTIRKALGTLKQGAFSYQYKGTKASCPYTIAYFDVEKKQFRSFNVGSLL